MATRKNTFLLKRSNVAGNIPTAGQIQLGELALNTSDVKLYASGTTTNSILQIGWDRVSRTGDTMTGTLYAPTFTGNLNGLASLATSATTALNSTQLNGQLASFYYPASNPNGYTTNTGTVTAVNNGNGMNFSNFTTSGTITLGTPSSLTLSSTNSVTTNSHTHAFAPGGTTGQYITGAGTLVTFPTIPTVNDGTLSMATSGIATGSASFTANQAGGSTFTVNVPATNLSIGSNTSTVVRVDSSTGTNTTLPVATVSLAGVLTSTDWSTFNGKQTQINGTGFVKAVGTTISYDNSTYYLASNPNGYTTNVGTVTAVNSGNGINFTNFSTSGTITLGTPSSTTLASTNATTTNSHTHAFAPGGTTAQYITGAGTLVTFPTIPTVNDGALTLATSGIATGSASFTANQAGASTFTVNVPATNLSIGVSSGTQVRVDSSTGADVDLPVASATLAGIVTTGAQTFAGTKTFSSTINGSVTGSAGSATNTNFVYLNDTNTNANFYISFGDVTNNYSRLFTDAASLYYNPSIDTLYSSYFVGLASNATDSVNSAFVGINNTPSTNATYYLTFTSSISGNQQLRVDSSTLTFNPSTDTLTVANLAGNASTATNSANIAVTNTTTTSGTYYLTFTSGVSGNQVLRTDSSTLTYNPNTNALATGILSASDYVECVGYGQFRSGVSGDRVFIGDPFGNGPVGVWDASSQKDIAVFRVSNGIFYYANQKIQSSISTGYVSIGGSPTGNGRFEVIGDNGAGVSIYASDDIVAFSDVSVKENIRPIVDVIGRVLNSRGIIYDRIDSKTKNNIGFIAQELEEQFPELVVTNEDGTKAVKYQNAVAVLFEAVKEQQKQLDGMQEQINNILSKLK